MESVNFKVNLFKRPLDRKESELILHLMLDTLVKINLIYYRNHDKIPSIYKAGVKYLAEDGIEDWKSIPEIIRDGYGDCEDLASWRVAELQKQGINARPFLKSRKLGNFFQYHVQVQFPNGFIEDPSLKLGMR